MKLKFGLKLLPTRDHNILILSGNYASNTATAKLLTNTFNTHHLVVGINTHGKIKPQ